MTSEEASENFLDFNRRLKIIYQNTYYEDKSRIHYKSLRNFIYHYNSSKKGKTKCTELLKGYIELIEGQNFFFTEEQSKASFDLYIGPLGQNFYSRYVNFSAAFSIVFEFFISWHPPLLYLDHLAFKNYYTFYFSTLLYPLDKVYF